MDDKKAGLVHQIINNEVKICDNWINANACKAFKEMIEGIPAPETTLGKPTESTDSGNPNGGEGDE